MSFGLTSIYRYPIKGFSPQPLNKIAVKPNAPLPWDRAFAIENGPSGFEATNPSHISKNAFLVLMKQPELAKLKTDFDPASGTMTIILDDEVKATGNLLTHTGASEIEAFLSHYCHRPLAGPAKILHSPGHAFTDSRTQDLTLINLASIRALEEKIGSQLDPLRFRANLYFDSNEAWVENDWISKDIHIGDVKCHVRKRTMRCAATNANPQTGERDQMIPKALMTHFGHADMGVHITITQPGSLEVGQTIKAPA